MYKILILAFREYKTSIRTKAFIIGLVVLPLFMGGGMFAWAFFQDKVDVTDKKISIIDHTGKIAQTVFEAAEKYNKTRTIDSETGEQVKPAYIITIVEPDSADLFKQKRQLSKKVRKKKIHAFVVIGPDVISPGENTENSQVKYYSENSFLDDIKNWLNHPINNRVRRLRVAKLGIDESEIETLFNYVRVKGMGLVKENEGTGKASEAKESNPIESILIPYIMVMLLFMMIIMSAVPLLNSVMEEKTERIAEVLLGSVSPFQFMMGKVIGGISVSLTGALIYVVAGILVTRKLGYAEFIPMDLIPWFFIYLFFSIVMFGTIMAALGSACNDNKDAQSLQFPAMLPIIIPIMVIMPVLKEPLGKLATGLSFFPPFTPMIMLIRQASPATIPTWQPIVGLIGVILFTALSIWAGGKIFRTMILIQGKRPKIGTLIKLLVKK